MNTTDELLRILKQDRMANISVVNFVEDNVISDIEQVGNGWIIRGTSDRNWVYVHCRTNQEAADIRSRLRETDTCFGAIEDWMRPILIEDRTVRWDLSLAQYILPDLVVVPDPPHATRTLTPDDAVTVYEHSTYRDFISVDYIQQRIQVGPGRGIEQDGQLAAWGLTQDDGALGFLHVRSAFRRNGYGSSVTRALIGDVRKSGRVPFAYIEPDNHKSIGLVTGLGFVRTRACHWFEAIPDPSIRC